MSMPKILDHFPDGALSRPANELHEVMQGPTLVRLTGRRANPLFVSVLLHGNEDTGWEALRGLLTDLAGRRLPRSLAVFVGNVEAARHGVRRLEYQQDYNRVWPGGEASDSPEARMLASLTDHLRTQTLFASIDIHNNTGLNPHYSGINRLDHRYLQLATLFSRVVVYFTRPTGVCSMAMGEHCPAVTLECGQPGVVSGIDHVRDYLRACLSLSEIPDHPVAHHDLDLFHTVATVKVTAGVTIGFGHEPCDLCFPEALDHLNFRELPAGTLIAQYDGMGPLPLDVVDERGEPVADRYLARHGNAIQLKRSVMPAMLTRNTEVIRQDCLGYFMERYPLPDAEPPPRRVP
jgi:succinylglutamate desuccinylase